MTDNVEPLRPCLCPPGEHVCHLPPTVHVGQVTFAPRLESQAVIGDKVFDMHTHEPVDLLALPYKLAVRNLRRELLVHAREHRAGWDPSRGYTEGLRLAARRLRQLLR